MSFDLQPHLKGELIELRPLMPEDCDGLFGVASDPLIWEQHPESDRSTRFHGYAPERSEIEIGWTFLARKYWGGRYNRELKDLMLAHAFKFVENVVFYVGQNNIRSQRATEKIGGIKSGVVKKTYGNRPPSLNVRYVIKRLKID